MYIYILLGVVISFIILFLVALKYSYFLTKNNYDFSISRSFLAITTAQFLGFLFPIRGSSIIIRSLLTIEKKRSAWAQVALLNILEQLIDILWYFFLFAILIIFFGRTIIVYNIWVIMLIIVILISTVSLYVYRRRVILFIKNKMKKRVEWINNRFPNLSINDQQYEQLWDIFNIKFSVICIIILINVLIAVVFPGVLCFTLYAFQYHISYYEIFGIFWLSILAGRFSGIVLGLGVREIVLQTFLMHKGLPVTECLKIVLLVRAITLIPILLAGSFSSFMLSREYISSLIATIRPKKKN